jgi:hypothetical protein
MVVNLLGIVHGEALRQMRPPAGQPRLDRAGWDAEVLGDLVD